MKSFRTATIVGAGVLSTCVAQPVVAELPTDRCIPMAEMNAALKAEGQRTMIIGNRSAVLERDAAGNPTRVAENAEAITSNADGSAGYSLIGDRPREEVSTCMRVRSKLTHVRLYDARQLTIAPDAYLGGSFNTLVNDNAARGTRPMVVADTVFPDGNGGTRLGRPIVLFGNVEGRNASLVAYTANQEPAALAYMVSTDYTPAAMEILPAQRPAP